MDQKLYAQLKKEIDEAFGKIHMAGIKGEALNEFIRATVTKLHFKWIQKGEGRIEGILAQMEKDIEQHLVVKVEAEEYKIVHSLIKDHIFLYATLHSILIFEKNDLGELNQLKDEFRKVCEKKGMPADIVKEVMTALDDAVNKWKAHVDEFRSSVNSVYNNSRGTFGSNTLVGLSLFQKLHNDGYMARLKERTTFMEAYRDNKRIADIKKKLGQVSDKKELEKLINDLTARVKEMTNDFNIIAKFLFATWNHLDQNMAQLAQIVTKAAGVHELPQADMQQMNELLELINLKLNEKFLHSLRISNKQVEAINEDVRKDIDVLKKYAKAA